MEEIIKDNKDNKYLPLYILLMVVGFILIIADIILFYTNLGFIFLVIGSSLFIRLKIDGYW